MTEEIERLVVWLEQLETENSPRREIAFLQSELTVSAAERERLWRIGFELRHGFHPTWDGDSDDPFCVELDCDQQALSEFASGLRGQLARFPTRVRENSAGA